MRRTFMTRSKSLPIRSSRKSLDPYHPSPASLPEEANQGVSNKRYPPQIEIGDDDVEIVTDAFDGRDKKRHCVGTSEPLNLEACIVCETSDELVYRCCGADCLLWFHEECLNAEFGSGGGGEDPANPFCPYCWFQILAVESIRLKEKAVGAEMAVFKYILDEEMRSRGEVDERVPKGQEDSVDATDIVSDQEVEAEKVAYSSKVDEKDSDESRGEDMALVEETDQSEGEKENFEVRTDKVEDDEERVVTENFQDAEDDETAGDKTTGNTCAGKERDVSPFLSMQESFSGKEHDQVQQSEKRRRKRRLILNAFDSDVSSNGSTNEPNGEDAAEQMTSLTLVVTSPLGMTKNHQREDSRTTKVDNSKTVRDIPIFKMDQKRRLLWTPEEEYMLKVGVEKFSAEAKKNIPWRKILEMGQKVFHETRTPSDLKDKWRNMTGARLKNKQDSTR
ncbi:PREDICTED: uncharacterized protein LOC106315917 isoform X2 [Brassica oleracea var. oleracea]|uniref:uncharacterized protein LOC106315917 isoform X2 n=1 Tax=Brassica oleracea var. oleracea TaxID=109376 RepID=UPI0006A6CC2D|nr:PREDICTED: uncharacterized protein LOC106315917 isoform X2 [Brassica oleracea var. oleracea]